MVLAAAPAKSVARLRVTTMDGIQEPSETDSERIFATRGVKAM